VKERKDFVGVGGGHATSPGNEKTDKNRKRKMIKRLREKEGKWATKTTTASPKA
jgi:hypothetical protein